MKKTKIFLMAALLMSTFWFSACAEESSDSSAVYSPNADSSVKTASLSEDSENSSSNSTDFSDWVERRGLDEFGDPTGAPYISYIAEGTFSNTATTNSPLYVHVKYTAGGYYKFELYEYGTHKVINSYGKTKKYDIAKKYESGKTAVLNGSMSSNEDYILELARYGEPITEPQIIKYVITDRDRPTTKYSFSVDFTGLAETYDKSLLKLAEEEIESSRRR